MNKVQTKKILMGMLIIVFLALLILAADYWRVNDEAAVTQIDEQGLCKKVDNDCGYDLFIPTKTYNEWYSFVLHYPVGVVITNCGECTNPLQCGILYPSCNSDMDCFSYWCCYVPPLSGTCPVAICPE